MYRMTLLTIGSLKSPWIKQGSEDYLARLRKSMRVDLEELPASKSSDSAKQREEESARIERALEKYRDSAVVLLDEKGKPMNSENFAAFIGKHQDLGKPMCFVIGGAYGLSEHLKKAIGHHVRLSDFTFTHEIARLVLLEQLYRASEILRGSGYHH
jgi:23S rRNA (pseudouridine1915-N3)-methyltransferase